MVFVEWEREIGLINALLSKQQLKSTNELGRGCNGSFEY
jgi:hypothetical protein